MKKVYIEPEIEIMALNCQKELLMGSGAPVNDSDTEDGNDEMY